MLLNKEVKLYQILPMTLSLMYIGLYGFQLDISIVCGYLPFSNFNVLNTSIKMLISEKNFCFAVYPQTSLCNLLQKRLKTNSIKIKK